MDMYACALHEKSIVLLERAERIYLLTATGWNSEILLEKPSGDKWFLQDYSVTLVYYLSHYLVDIANEKTGRILKLDAVDEGHSKWCGADVLVFGSWRWWGSKT